jgi:hypothetical protein
MGKILFGFPVHNHKKTSLVLALIALTLAATIVNASLAANSENTQPAKIEVAEFTNLGALGKPKALDKWIHMGSNIGHGYNGESFAADDPGTFRVVAMEPSSYDYFIENGEYANGTMFSLSVFDVLSKVEPDLNGFSQGKLRGFEIHLIDSERNKDGREFFMFAADDLIAAPLADQSACVNCHLHEAQFESTFVQFYPKLKRN